jgi:hypothetical protein
MKLEWRSQRDTEEASRFSQRYYGVQRVYSVCKYVLLLVVIWECKHPYELQREDAMRLSVVLVTSQQHRRESGNAEQRPCLSLLTGQPGSRE